MSHEQPALLHISSAVSPDGTPDLRPLEAKTLQAKHVNPLVAKLYAILKELPTEQPPGSQDIYGLNTCIKFGSDDLKWSNGGPQGCGGGERMVQVNDAQKKQFKRAVDIVNELVQKAE